MNAYHDQILRQVADLNVNKSGDRRAPHKPLLLLIALAALQQGQRTMRLGDVEEQLLALLRTYAPPVKSRHQPELPFWHLQSDGLWVVHDADHLPRQRGGFPRKAALRSTTAQFPDAIAEALLTSPTLVEQMVRLILDRHFRPSLHDDLLDAVGLTLENASGVAEPITSYETTRKRDPHFRKRVLRAYEHRCAVTGFRAALAGTFFGCEAAHVRAHAEDGPDEVANGMALEPTLHKLFDVGAWSLTDDRRILVSAEFTGTDQAIERLRTYHGQPLRSPQPGHPTVDPVHIRWHREPDRGGIFKHPALSL